MQKPGLGARKCGHCGARIEGPQSHLLQQCPQCRSPLYGRYVPAPPTPLPTQRGGPTPQPSGGGHTGAIIIGLFLFAGVAIAGVVGVLMLSKKEPTSGPTNAPPASVSAGIPVLADLPDASPSASIKKPPPAGTVPRVVPTVPTAKPSATTIATVPVPSASQALVNVQRCGATLTVGSIRPSRSTCTLNEKVSRGPGKMDFPCEGGAATAAFSTQQFRGSVTATTVSLAHVEQFQVAGCKLESSQRIFGTRTSPTGTYSYSERIVSGTCTGVTTCTASASVDFR